MEMIPWVLAGLFAGLSVYLAFRRPRGLPPEPVDHRASMTTGKDRRGEDPDDLVLRGMARYLGTAVLSPLEGSLRKGDTRGAVEDAVEAAYAISCGSCCDTLSLDGSVKCDLRCFRQVTRPACVGCRFPVSSS